MLLHPEAPSVRKHSRAPLRRQQKTDACSAGKAGENAPYLVAVGQAGETLHGKQRMRFKLPKPEEGYAGRGRPEKEALSAENAAVHRLSCGCRADMRPEKEPYRMSDTVLFAVWHAFRLYYKYFPVTLSVFFLISSGVPTATMRPPASPPPGPMSMT